MSRLPLPPRTTVASAAALLAGCSLVTDLDRFEAAGSGGSGGSGGMNDAGGPDAGGGEDIGCANPQTLCVRLSNWPHRRQLTVVDLVSDDNNLRARAVLDPFGDGTQTTADVVMPLAIPEGDVPKAKEEHPLHLEIWADQNEDGEYTPDIAGVANVDHDWERDLPADGNFEFVHDTAFNDLLPRPRDIGPDFRMRLTGFHIHAGLMLEVMVIEDVSGRAVGLLRLEIPDESTFDVEIPGIIDPGGVVYRVEFYADVNDNRSYDDPPDDHTWVLSGESNDQGIEFEFDHMGMFTPLDYQFDFEE